MVVVFVEFVLLLLLVLLVLLLLFRSFIRSGNMGADKLRCSDVNWNEVDTVVDVVVVVVEDAIGFVSFRLLVLVLVLLVLLLLDDVNQPTAVDVTTLPKLRGAGGGFLEELIRLGGKCWISCRMGWWVAYVVFVLTRHYCCNCDMSKRYLLLTQNSPPVKDI